MRSEVIGDTAINPVYYSEDRVLEAYSHIFKFLAEQEGEGGGGVGWKPSKTGLHLCMAPPGKGRSMWVSEEGKEDFLGDGEDAIKKL